MTDRYCLLRRPISSAGILIGLLSLLVFCIVGVNPAWSYYFPPTNIPPGPPPNYNQVDSTFFLGEPSIPLPPPDSGGFYVWVDSTGCWNVANHIYSKGNSLEQFHASVLAVMSSQPNPGVNVLATNFELFGDTVHNLCYKQNDHWGWYQWDEDLYEIWWDVSTREYRCGEGDINDFMKICIVGSAIDFNLWSSGHCGDLFGTDQIFLGGSMTRLCDVPGFSDTFEGIDDPYQSQAGSNPESDPNITIFTYREGNGATYNVDGIISPGQTYPCGPVLGEDYGDRFGGSFVYEGNGVQFSSEYRDPCEGNLPPELLGPFVYNIFQCEPEEFCFDVDAYDPDENIHHFEKLFGPGTIDSLTGEVCFTPEYILCDYIFTIVVIDSCGAADTANYGVNVTFNSPPVASCPGDTTIFLCDTTEICIPGFTYYDPDNNIAYTTVIGCEIYEDTVCFIPEVNEKTITFIVIDSCDVSDTCQTHVTIIFNSPPTCYVPDDTTIFQCEPSQVCLPVSCTDPDDNLLPGYPAMVSGPGQIVGGNWCYTPSGDEIAVVTIRCQDECDAYCEATFTVAFDINEPPVVSCHDDTSLFLCEIEEICIPGFDWSDPDDNIDSVYALGGTLTDHSVCLTPVEGVNTITLICVDECSSADTCFTQVTVELNSPPEVSCPGDTIVHFICEPGEICLGPFTSSDNNNNIDSCYIIDNGLGGVFDGTNYCFTPSDSSTYEIGYACIDLCDLADTCVVTVSVLLDNQPPIAYCPGDTSVFLCEIEQVCIPGFDWSDPDDNIDSVYALGGTLTDHLVCLTPVEGLNTITLICVDECGLADTCFTQVTVELNSPPACHVPNDTTVFQCEPTEVCLPVSCSDPDNNLLPNYPAIVSGPGQIVGGNWCYTPSGDEIAVVTIRCQDECDAYCEATFTVAFDINEPPVVSCHDDTSLFLCEIEQVCIPGFDWNDPDDNIDSVYALGGTLTDHSVCLTPVEGVNTITLICVDECSSADTCFTQVTVELNSPPEVSCPGDTTVHFICEPGEICLGPFTSSDDDNNIDSCYIIDNGLGGVFDGTNYCFTPSDSGTYEIGYACIDLCGLADTCVVAVSVLLDNQPPIAYCPGDTSVFLCEIEQVCIPGFDWSDPDDNIDSVYALGGTLTDHSVCLTPVEGLNTITLICVDECGLADTCFTQVTIELNNPPEVFCPSDTSVPFTGEPVEICLGPFTSSDDDNNIDSCYIIDNGLGGVFDGTTYCFTVSDTGTYIIGYTCVDFCGEADTCFTQVYVFWPGTCPEIINPVADTINMCIYENFCDTIEVIDEDGDFITVTVNIGELTELVNEPGYWLGIYCFTIPDTACGNFYNYEVIIEASDGVCSDYLVYYIDVLGVIDMFFDQEVEILPGDMGRIGLYLNTYNCLCVGGLNASVYWDASILELIEVIPTENLDFGNEYLNVNIGAFGQGTVKISYIADLNDQNYHGPLCDIDPDEPIFWFDFLLAPDDYPTDFLIPICFVDNNPINDNSVADSTGYHVWFSDGCSDPPDSSQYGTLLLNLECGHFRVINCESIVIGDLNLNGFPFEVGDAIVLANYLIDPEEYPLTLRQMWASDANGDSIQASIADLVFILNITSGNGNNPKLTPPTNIPVEFVINDNGDGETIVKLSSDIKIGGFVLEIPIPENTDAELQFNSELDMDVLVNKGADNIRFCVYSFNGKSIECGTTELLRINHNNKEKITISSLSLSDAYGNLVEGLVKYELPLPEKFYVIGNHPNPFNSSTSIEFALPSADMVTLRIYDIAGRLVDDMNLGQLEAGYHHLTWNGKNQNGKTVTSGIYFAKLLALGEGIATETIKLALIK